MIQVFTEWWYGKEKLCLILQSEFAIQSLKIAFYCNKPRQNLPEPLTKDNWVFFEYENYRKVMFDESVPISISYRQFLKKLKNNIQPYWFMFISYCFYIIYASGNSRNQ